MQFAKTVQIVPHLLVGEAGEPVQLGRRDLRRLLITGQNRDSLANPKTTIAMAARKFDPSPIALSGPGTFTVVQRDSRCPVCFAVQPVGSVLLFLAPPPRCQVLLLDLEDNGLCSILRHELWWSRFDRKTVCAGASAQDDMPDGQADWLLSILNRKKRAGAICVALLRKPNEDKQALAARIGGIDHVAVIPDAQMRNLVPVLNAQLGVPHDARIERISPKPRAAGAQIVAAAFAAVRPHQWIKNLLVFVPLLAAHQINLAALGQALLAFLAFCAVASGVYLLNDLMDLGADRRHLRKRRRPFASGALPLNWAPGLLLGTLALGGALGALVGPQFLAILVLYAGIATAYSLGLKRLVIADITILAGLYTLRIVAGGVATDIRLSIWLLAFSMFLFVALAAIKRLAELVEIDSSPQARVPGRAYRTSDLPFVATLAVASGHIAILILALYINSADFMLLYTTPAALWVACLVLYFWTMRLVLMAYLGQIIDDPIVYAVRDISSWTCAAILAAAVILASVEQPSLPWVSQ